LKYAYQSIILFFDWMPLAVRERGSFRNWQLRKHEEWQKRCPVYPLSTRVWKGEWSVVRAYVQKKNIYACACFFSFLISWRILVWLNCSTSSSINSIIFALWSSHNSLIFMSRSSCKDKKNIKITLNVFKSSSSSN
jgi:hypothetical protein